MTRSLVRLGDKTTSGGEVLSASSSIIEERNIVLNGDMAWCPKETCNGLFQINGTAYHFAEDKPCVATGDRVLCHCKDNQVLGTTTIWVEDSPEDPFEEQRKRAAEWPITKAIAAAAALSSIPVFAKSCLRGEGCTDAGTDQESVDNFGYAGFYRASPQAAQLKEESIQHAQAAKKHKPAEPTSPPEDTHPWYKRLFNSPDTKQAAAAAGMATARVATTSGITTGAATEAGYAALQQIGGTLSTAGRWIAPSPPTVLLFGMFYSPKLNSGEQDYINKMRLEQAAQNKEDVPTRVRFRWEADQNGMIRPKGFHVSARGGQDKVPVRMLQKNTTTGNYEFWEDGTSKPTIIWTPDDPGYVSPSNTGNRDNVYVPPSVLVYPESEINSPWSTETPAPGERPFRDYILVHPAGTFDPIYVYLSKNPDDPIWTKTKAAAPVENAYGHWVKHGHEFQDKSFNNSKEYVDATHDFVRTPPAGTLTKVRQNGDVMYYHPATNTFSVKTKDGVPKTMFKPNGGLEYWEKQK
ncbi:S-type pyocin domain-containing protein [Enterobacter sp. Bisph1]|uniref:S-type pyocin domain-containing protein n=1 Tax=Enterobacter sp. Bisph1 TaxID=1274399 RepID=UPI000907D219|nr:S-type pyocin domain-containing protein [Enterobacter sp. Bisph1]